MLLAAPRFNYEAVCGIYFLASIGLGGNIPVDAIVALEFLPQRRRTLVALLSMFQPIGVVVASAIAYGTAARYRCDATAPYCYAQGLAPGANCCTVGSNMGWRYCVLVLGSMTLLVFFVRFLIFPFYESPKFLLSKGREQEAIDVLHKIAKFNKATPPTLTVEHFRAIDAEYGTVTAGPETTAMSSKRVIANFVDSIKKLKGLFGRKLQLTIFLLLTLAYMVSTDRSVSLFISSIPGSIRRGLQIGADSKGDYWSFNLAGAYLPLVLLQFNVSTGANSVTETYRQYIYIYLPGIIGAILAFFSVSLPLVGRKWSLVFSALMQGLSMALYTQVRTATGYVGLNALEYIMQTVRTYRHHMSNPFFHPRQTC